MLQNLSHFTSGRAGRVLKIAADLALGGDCALCLAPAAGAYACPACERSLRTAPRDPDITAAFRFAFPVDRVVRRFKFHADFAAGRWLAGRLAERVSGEPSPDLLVAPPLSRERLRERGFHQALFLARAVGEQRGIAVAWRGLSRRDGFAPQRGLSRAARLANLKDAFACDFDLAGRRVAVVDDVFTTGATFDALARVLRRQGATDVRAWVVARTPEPGA